jgi:hypothetical protein
MNKDVFMFNFMNTFSSVKFDEVTEPYNDEDLARIARFVNPKYTWPVEILLEVFDNMLNLDPTKIKKCPRYFGYPTPARPLTLTPCLLYKICVANAIHLTFNTSIQQMSELVVMLCKTIHYARSFIYHTLIPRLSRDDLIKLYNNAMNDATDRDDEMVETDTDELPNIEVEHGYEQLQRIGEELTNSKKRHLLLRRIAPMTNLEAIALGAIAHGIDLSHFQNPIDEYKHYVWQPDTYLPIDSNYSKAYRDNPALLYLSSNFNPSLPKELYEEQVLKMLAIAEGYSEQDCRDESPYVLLQTACLTNTFYHGKQAFIENTDTPIIYQTVSTSQNNSIVCFGVRAAPMTAFTLFELATFFESRRCFENPLAEDHSPFSSISIKKLKGIVTTAMVGDDAEIARDKSFLFKQLNAIEVLVAEYKELFLKLLDHYDKSTEEVRIRIKGVIIKLMHLAMYMRGWTGIGPLPIEEGIPGEYGDIAIRTTDQILIFERMIQDLGVIGETIMNLPLLRYIAGDYVHSTSITEGKTIGERLAVVKKGDDDNNVNGCIRMSSNWFAITSLRVMGMFKMELPFLPQNLRSLT